MSEVATKVSTNPVPGTPPAEIFELRYKKGGVCTNVRFKSTNINSAIEEAKDYCLKRKLHFIYVSNFLTDIKAPISVQEDNP